MLQVPTVSDTIIIRLMDRDVDGDDDVIGTSFLKLPSIAYFSQDDIGFDPTFGPCFINFDGAPRELTEYNERFQYLNEGWVPGTRAGCRGWVRGWVREFGTTSGIFSS